VIAYVDASVVLRLVLGESHRLRQWGKLSRAVSSQLAEVECLRTLDRLAARGLLSPRDLVTRRTLFFRLLEEIDLADLTRPILSRASQPFPTPLGTLDAIHLTTALLLRETVDEPVVFATHDEELARTASAVGFDVLGA
jgi:predicted nucleic acid-binding protein